MHEQLLCVNAGVVMHHLHVSETHWYVLLQYSHRALAQGPALRLLDSPAEISPAGRHWALPHATPEAAALQAHNHQWKNSEEAG